MFHYIQIDENGYVVSDSYLSGEVTADNMIRVDDDFDPTNKKYDFETKEWVECIPEPIEVPEPQPTQLDTIEANTTYLVMMMEEV